jgi:hypothetical protein
MWSSWGNWNWEGKPTFSEKTRPSTVLFITHATWPDLGWNSDRWRLTDWAMARSKQNVWFIRNSWEIVSKMYFVDFCFDWHGLLNTINSTHFYDFSHYSHIFINYQPLLLNSWSKCVRKSDHALTSWVGCGYSLCCSLNIVVYLPFLRNVRGKGKVVPVLK